MSVKDLLKLAQKFESDLAVDPEEVVHEHKEYGPISYMAIGNLKNIISDASDLLAIMNEEDDLPQWTDEMLAIAKNNISKALSFVKSQKIKTAIIEREDMIKIAAGKYDHIDFKPPQSVADAAKRGLELRKKNHGKGGLSVQEAHKQGIGSGVARAVSLKNRNNLSPSTVRRMKSFFARHEKNKKAAPGKKLSEDKGYISWLIWCGDPGRSWAEKICRQMDAADKKSKK